MLNSHLTMCAPAAVYNWYHCSIQACTRCSVIIFMVILVLTSFYLHPQP